MLARLHSEHEPGTCRFLYPPEGPKTKPNEAIAANPFSFSEMHEKFRKRSHCDYQSCFQAITSKKGPIFGKNEWSWFNAARRCLQAKTNWHGYIRDLNRVSSILVTQTGTLNHLNRQHLILKILEKFIRYAVARANRSQDGCEMKTNWHSHLAQTKRVSLFLPERSGRAKPKIQQSLILKMRKIFIPCQQQMPAEIQTDLLPARWA
jgi:hypothetical protein